VLGRRVLLYLAPSKHFLAIVGEDADTADGMKRMFDISDQSVFEQMKLVLKQLEKEAERQLNQHLCRKDTRFMKKLFFLALALCSTLVVIFAVLQFTGVPGVSF